MDIDAELWVVRFAHLSVREFLVEKNLEGEGYRMMAEWRAGIMTWKDFKGNIPNVILLNWWDYVFCNWGTHMLKSPRKDVDAYLWSVNMLVFPERRKVWTRPFVSKRTKNWFIKNISSGCHYLFIFARLGMHASE